MQHPISRRLPHPILALVLLAAPTSLDAQTTTLDEGAFRLILAGREVGTESFTIRQSGTGDDAVIIAQGTVVLDTADAPEELRAVLRVEGASFRPSAYEVTVRGPDPQVIAARVVGGRFSARIVSDAGEQMREYLASEGAIVVDAGVMHHHYFLARRVASGAARIPIIIPRRNRQVSGLVEDHGAESVRIGGRNVSARRLSVALAGAPERQVWVDERGRVLRIEIPANRFEAVRSSAPR
ncbi:MAG TPA: hypothetical protein VF158_14980 [Longimicrobiales bacterium]